MTSLLTKIKSLDAQVSTNTENISNKQDALTAGNNITIDVNNNISSSGINQSQLDTKQSTLNSTTTSIITGTIDSGNITGRTGTTITAPTITAGTNLLYGTTNVATKISGIEKV